MARVNGVPIEAPGGASGEAELRRRAVTELLRQEAVRAGLLADRGAPAEAGVPSEEEADAIESLLDRELSVPLPDEAAGRRFHAAHGVRFAVGERARLRHVLFAVTPGVDVNALRTRAEAALIELRCAEPGTDAFGQRARELSNCPSGELGGDLGWLRAEDCAPEFAREVFGHPEVGVLPRLVHSRFGLHVVEVLEREPGRVPAYEEVRESVSQAMHRQAFATALRQYLRVLAGRSEVEGVDLDPAEAPLLR